MAAHVPATSVTPEPYKREPRVCLGHRISAPPLIVILSLSSALISSFNAGDQRSFNRRIHRRQALSGLDVHTFVIAAPP